MTNEGSDEDGRLYRVVVNAEDQFSIWPADRKLLPPGWVFVGEARTKQACLDYIDEHWLDDSPLDMRKRMEEEADRIRRETGR